MNRLRVWDHYHHSNAWWQDFLHIKVVRCRTKEVNKMSNSFSTNCRQYVLSQPAGTMSKLIWPPMLAVGQPQVEKPLFQHFYHLLPGNIM